jgi:hypothetical protein
VRAPFRLLLALASGLGAFTAAGSAGAEPSAWMFLGGGPVGWKQEDSAFTASGAFSFDAGIGTSPENRFIVGGLLRATPVLQNGTDLALLARVATRGFQAGGFGLALDAGGYERFWGATSAGFAGAVNLGVPLGFTLSLQTEIGSDRAVSLGAIAGIDLLRLTVFRQSLLRWWPNPSPTQRAPEAASVGAARW